MLHEAISALSRRMERLLSVQMPHTEEVAKTAEAIGRVWKVIQEIEASAS